MGKIRTYVGDDGKLHFVNSGGADSVLPFSSGIIFKDAANPDWSEIYRHKTGSSKLTYELSFKPSYVLIFYHSQTYSNHFLSSIIPGVKDSIIFGNSWSPTGGSLKYYMSNGKHYLEAVTPAPNSGTSVYQYLGIYAFK